MDSQDEPGQSEQASRLAQYDDLVRFSKALNDERTFDALLEFIAREAAAVMRAERSSIFLCDRQSNELWARVALGVRDQIIRFPSHLGIAGHSLTTGQSVSVADPYADPRFNADVDRQTGYKTRSILCAPLRARDGQVIGVLEVLNKHGGPFTSGDQHLGETLASQCAVAIENVLLYEQLRAAEELGAEPGSPSPKVLLADDDEMLGVLVAEALGQDVQLVGALDGEEALEKVETERPDLVLLDVTMPRKDGFETCRALRERQAGHELPIIMLTASRRPEDVIHAFEAGANDYIVKPFSLAQLRAKTHTWLLRKASS
ncbi:MAG TPA: response regulator [Chloroflexota bacterium]|nr:response regulator [Chloroflexota bacterium]